MIRNRVTLLAGVIVLLAASPALASGETVETRATFDVAQDPFSRWGRQDEARQETREGRRISAAEALSRVRARARRGHHMSIEEERRGGRVVFVIMWDYENGRIGRFTVDGQTGRVSGG